MATDQHFCLRWNNHQSTLISVFDTLLESGTLVDCTLAADGQQLKAHKVVLSACSPYLEALLSQHYDKHPIIILRDVKFPELKAMLDYMYRGEVNITQEQLGTFLKAAESLQIKGLTDSGGGGGMGGESKRHDIRKQLTMPPAAVTPQTRPRTSGLGGGNGGEIAARKSAAGTHIPAHIMDVAPSSPLKAREGSVSPVVKKRRKPDHPQHNDDARLVQTSLATDNGGSPSSDPSDEPLINNTPNNNNSWPPKIDNNKVVDNNTNSTNNNNNSSSKDKTAAAALAAVKCEQSAEDLLQPKAEYIDADDTNDNENSADDDDDDDDGANKMDASKPGPSHSANTQGYQSWMEDDSSNEESGASNNQQNSQGYGQWHVSTDGSADETMMTAPPQDSQGNISKNPPSNSYYRCDRCGRMYTWKTTLQRHKKLECGKAPRFDCPYCNFCSKQKHNLKSHILLRHKLELQQSGGGPVRKYLNQMQVANWDSWSAAHPSVSNLLQRALSTYSPPSAAEQTSSTSPTAFKGVECPKCGRHYKLKSSLRNHQKWECGKEPQFQCPYCNYRAKQKMHVARHIERMHREKLDMLDINDKTVAAAIKDEKPFTTT